MEIASLTTDRIREDLATRRYSVVELATESLQFAQIRHIFGQTGDVLDQGLASGPHVGILGVDQNFGEEAVDGGLQSVQDIAQDKAALFV